MAVTEQRRWPAILLELFVWSNLAFLTVDVWMAHAFNSFRDRAEWAPVIFSGGAAVLMLLGIIAGRGMPRKSINLHVGYVIGFLSILLGILGMWFHLESRFFDEVTVKSLVYTAPFIAPLAYTGLGFLLVMNRMVPAESRAWSLWVILLALGGFVGNFVLSLCDHAQNGFFNPMEWGAVVGSALAVGSLLVFFIGQPGKALVRYSLIVMALQTVVGVLGFALHLMANLQHQSASLTDKFIFGAPVFAPLLFADLAMLAVLGIIDYALKAQLTRTAPAHSPLGTTES